MPTRQTPPAPGYSYDTKSRGWFQSTFGSYAAAKASGEPGAAVSRRQYDQIYGRIEQQGLGTYEGQAKYRKALREENPEIILGNVTRDGQWYNLEVGLTNPDNLAALLQAAGSVVSNNSIFMITGIGDADPYPEPEPDEQDKKKTKGRKRKPKQARADGLKYRNVLSSTDARALTNPRAIRALIRTIRGHCNEYFNATPSKFLIQWRAR